MVLGPQRFMNADNTLPGAVLDVEGTLARFGGDRDLFVELGGMLLEDLPPLLNELREAVRAGEARDVRARAHALQGLVSGCGGVRAAHVARQLENAGQNDDLSAAPQLLATLSSEVDLLIRSLNAYLAEASSAKNGPQLSR
jgi:HPt (histidine-containing phosphotransfer) domain-containing protein